MLLLGHTKYRLCLLDTNAMSEMVLRPEGMFLHFLEWAVQDDKPTYIPCFTVYTVFDLRRKPQLFARFIRHFSPFACVMLRGYNDLLNEEVAHYPDPSQIDICSLAFTPLGGEGNLLPNLPTLLNMPEHAKKEDEWNREAPEIVKGMVSLVQNHPPAGSAYTDDEVKTFVSTAALQQVALHGHTGFVQRIHSTGQAVDIDAFPSMKSIAYTVFHKFYADPTRKPPDSDAFDVLAASTFPYVEAVITEAHLAETLKKTKRRDTFLEDLQVFTMRDFRGSSPRR